MLYIQVSLYSYRIVSSTSSDSEDTGSDSDGSVVFVGEDPAPSMYVCKLPLVDSNVYCIL